MKETILENEPLIRFLFFIGTLMVFAGLEFALPRKKRVLSRAYRWINNIVIIFLNTFMLRLVFPTAVVGVAYWSESQGVGLFYALEWPFSVKVILSILILDLVIWFQHLCFHNISWLWRLHEMHHTDLDLDLTTGLRFHPLEILISIFIKSLVVVILGAPALGVLISEILLNSFAIFNHANFRMPLKLDRFLRLFFVTPDMHRVHHSWHKHETNSNYGFNLSIWDRLFKTYIDRPQDGHDEMVIGTECFRDPRWERADRMLVLPFYPRKSYLESEEGS